MCSRRRRGTQRVWAGSRSRPSRLLGDPTCRGRPPTCIVGVALFGGPADALGIAPEFWQCFFLDISSFLCAVCVCVVPESGCHHDATNRSPKLVPSRFVGNAQAWRRGPCRLFRVARMGSLRLCGVRAWQGFGRCCVPVCDRLAVRVCLYLVCLVCPLCHVCVCVCVHILDCVVVRAPVYTHTQIRSKHRA